jgi:hypothetical protein
MCQTDKINLDKLPTPLTLLRCLASFAVCSGVIIPPGSQTPLPTFWSQLTGRAVFVGLLVGAVFLLLTMRLSLAAGVAPNLQVVIAGACWALLRVYTLLLGRDMTCIPALNAQEVSVAAAAALAVASTAAAGGFGSVLLAIQDPAVQRVGSSAAGNLPSVVWSLAYGKLLCYLLLVGLSGALLMLAFRKPLFGSPAMTFATGAGPHSCSSDGLVCCQMSGLFPCCIKAVCHVNGLHRGCAQQR